MRSGMDGDTIATMPANRERLNTEGSYSSVLRHTSAGGLRERTNTVDSVRSICSADGSELHSMLLMGNASPPVSRKHVVIPPTSQVRLTLTKSNSSGGVGVARQRRTNSIVDWLQKQPVPLLRQHSRVYSSNPDEAVFLITGLDRVVYGTVAAADSILIAGAKPPRYLWYMLSGACCDVIQFAIDVILHVIFDIQDASMCWALGFGFSIVFRHSFHRYLVFGDYVGGYWASLGRMYAAYSVILVLSTAFNMFMTKVVETSHYTTWILTLLWTGIANYFILKKIWSFGGVAANSEKI
jgi:hypothetical protein